MKRSILAVVTLLAVASCGGDDNSPTGPTLTPTTSAPYSQTDLVVGTGAIAQPGNNVTVAYTGWLHDSSRPDAKGAQFDSSPSFQFRLGTGAVIRGWDQGVAGMRVGGQRRLVIPPDLAYGDRSPGGIIPPNATLVFEVELLSIA